MCSVYSTKIKTAGWPFALFSPIQDNFGINLQNIFYANKPPIVCEIQTTLCNLAVSLLAEHLKDWAIFK